MNMQFMNDSEKEMLSYMLLAPASEIDALIPINLMECAKLLELDRPYDCKIDYFPMIAKLRRQWAQAMIAEAMGQGGEAKL